VLIIKAQRGIKIDKIDIITEGRVRIIGKIKLLRVHLPQLHQLLQIIGFTNHKITLLRFQETVNGNDGRGVYKIDRGKIQEGLF
jgi:hypothetical protein